MNPKYKEDLSNLRYLINELKDTADRTKKDLPEDLHKVFIDLVYHANNILKGMEADYREFIKTWNDCCRKI